MNIADWHPWFAWHPVWLSGNWAWLRRVERKWTGRVVTEEMSALSAGDLGDGYWKYRKMPMEKKPCSLD